MAETGHQTRAWSDPRRRDWADSAQRPLLTEVWHPGGDGRFPCVLLSHGTGGSAGQMAWLGEALAARGYVAAAVNHHGNTSVEPYVPQGFGLWWERARDLTAVLDLLLADAFFGARIDPARIGAAGFSLGGYTVIALAGAPTDLRAFGEFCGSPQRDAGCDEPPEFPGMLARLERLKRVDLRVQASLRAHNASYRDRRVGAVFAIAPVLANVFTPAGLAGVSVPVAIVVGEADAAAPLATNAQRLARFIPGAALTVLPGQVAHYTFLAQGSAQQKRAEPRFYVDHPSVDRAAVHRMVAGMAADFFAQQLVRAVN